MTEEKLTITKTELVVCTTIINWAMFAFFFVVIWLHFDTRNLENELKYMQYYRESVTSGALQDVMCNGTPVG